jgi:chromosome segregation ATPase
LEHCKQQLQRELESLRKRSSELQDELVESREREQNASNRIIGLQSKLDHLAAETDVSEIQTSANSGWPSTILLQRARSEHELKMKGISAQLRKVERANFLLSADLVRAMDVHRHSSLECERLRQALVEMSSDTEMYVVLAS